MPKDLGALWNGAFHKVFSTGKIETLEFDFPTSDRITYFHLRIVPEFTEDGTVKSVISIAGDIADIKWAKETLRNC